MKYYEFKQVLGALRGEYLKFQKELDPLKDYMRLYCDEDTLYLCGSKINDNDRLNLSYVIDTGKKDRISDRSYIMSGTIFNGNYQMIYKPPRFKIYETDPIKEKMNELDETKFARNMNITNSSEYRPKTKDEIHKLAVWAHLLKVVIDSNNLSSPESLVFYRPYEDRLYIDRNNPSKRVNDRFVMEVMHEKIPEELFMDYHKDLIESYPEKDLEIINTKNNHICNKYEIVDERKRLILKR